jgi:hypothetical protein
MLLIPKIAKVTKKYTDRFKKFTISAEGEDGICENQFSMFLKLQNEFYGKDIDEQCEIQNLIDDMYLKNVWIIKCQFYMFIFGFMCPFLLQVIKKDDSQYVIIMITICLVSQSIFMLQELRQIQIQGYIYFTDVMNFMQIMIFGLFIWYYRRRLEKPD